MRLDRQVARRDVAWPEPVARSGARNAVPGDGPRCPNASGSRVVSRRSEEWEAVLEGRASFAMLSSAMRIPGSTCCSRTTGEQRGGSTHGAEVRRAGRKTRTHYDAIIIDSPPIGLVSDALTDAPLVDQM